MAAGDVEWSGLGVRCGFLLPASPGRLARQVQQAGYLVGGRPIRKEQRAVVSERCF
jgi:hypothetical protein